LLFFEDFVHRPTTLQTEAELDRHARSEIAAKVDQYRFP
jgi:hypothetical protein